MIEYSPETIHQYTNKRGYTFDIGSNKFGFFALNGKGKRITGNVGTLELLHTMLEKM